MFLAFGRVFSGRVREGQRLHVLSSAYTPARPGDVQRRTGTVRAVYLMMGTGLERLASVPAGNVLALAGFEDSILKTATLASTPCCPPMAAMTFQVRPPTSAPDARALTTVPVDMCQWHTRVQSVSTLTGDRPATAALGCGRARLYLYAIIIICHVCACHRLIRAGSYSAVPIQHECFVALCISALSVGNGLQPL